MMSEALEAGGWRSEQAEPPSLSLQISPESRLILSKLKGQGQSEDPGHREETLLKEMPELAQTGCQPLCGDIAKTHRGLRGNL